MKRSSSFARIVRNLFVSTPVGALPSIAIEEPADEVIERLGAAEIRAYEPIVVAETVVDGEFDHAGNAAFRRLAGHIFGGNRARDGETGAAKIAMTAPVAMRPAGATEDAGGADSWVVSFTMPREWTLATLPVPNDPLVTLREAPARTVAALRFSGVWSDKKFVGKERELRAALAGSPWRIVGPAESARYNPPWTPWFPRRNEVLLELHPASG